MVKNSLYIHSLIKFVYRIVNLISIQRAWDSLGTMSIGQNLTPERELEVKRKNRNIVGKYLALYLENSDKNKAMVTFTANCQTVAGNKTISQAFVTKVNQILRRKAFKGEKFKYFSNVEFGQNPIQNIHVHLQCYYDSIEPLQEAFDYVINQFNLNPAKCDLSVANDHALQYTYVIKDYLSQNFNSVFEDMKDKSYKGTAMHSCSQKDIPNYVIRKLYQLLSRLPSWSQTKDKYAYIIDLIDKGFLSIQKIGNKFIKGYRKIKRWLYRIDYKSLLTQTHPYTIDNSKPHLNRGIFTAIFILFFILLLGLGTTFDLNRKIKIENSKIYSPPSSQSNNVHSRSLIIFPAIEDTCH